MRRFNSLSFKAAIVLAVVTIGARTLNTAAHKVVTSRYSYNTDIFPIVREHCGRCHVEGGPAPMALLKYNDGPDSATPWAESIRQSIVGEYMPPWYVDPQGPQMRGGLGLNAVQADKILTWTTGGTPEGDTALKPEKAVYQSRWSGGMPDLKVSMEADYLMPAGESEATKEFVLRTGLSETRWLRAVDLMPGAPAIVRNASISLDNGTVLAVWVPGDNLISAPNGAAFRVPAGSRLRLQIHYKKQWQNESKAIGDRSTVGLYFTKQPAAGGEIEAVALKQTLGAKSRVVAVTPSLDQVYGNVLVQAVTPSGAKIALLKLRVPRPEWRRRYWLANPIEVPAGSRIEMITSSPASYIDLSGARFLKPYPLDVAVEFVKAQ